MSVESYVVNGRRFFGEADYKAALRDQEKIEAIRKEYHLNKAEDIVELYSLMQTGNYHFETVLGTEFDDEIYELYSNLPSEARKARRKMDNEDSEKRETKKSGLKHRKKQTTGEIVSLDDFDEDMQAAIKAELKKQERKRTAMIIGFSVLAVICFSYLGIYYYQNYRTMSTYEQLADIKNKVDNFVTAVSGEETEPETETPEVLEEYKTLLIKNQSLIGWLKIDDKNIDYPVMQTVDNDYYLSHDFNQNYDNNGSIFMDYSCDVIDRSTNLIIYGHNMKSGNMFGNLDKYSDEAYYEAHPRIYFDTIYEKGVYEIVYVFRSRIYNESDVVFKYYQFIDAASEVEFDSNMNEMDKLSLYDTGITPKYGDQLLTLSTCDYQEDNGRFVVVARKIISES